jgi:hypothetical protein
MIVAVFDTKPYGCEYLAHASSAEQVIWLEGTLLT